ncbi:MAG: hypothetical protein ACR2GX_03185 [Candidatus Dormibacteria bacterium]
MIHDADRLDAALNGQRIGVTLNDVSPAVRVLVDIAADVANALGEFRLTAADHDRIYAESLLRLEATLRAHRHLWNRVHIGRRGAAVMGGAAAATVVTVAAIGIAVVHERHKQRDRVSVAA